jgi:site-specific DNA-methyltransferase (adenine-specific)
MIVEQIGDCTLYLGDCLDVLPTLGKVDAVVTDPPYNLGINYGSLTNDRRIDYERWCTDWFTGLEPICSETIAISCGVANISMWCHIKEPAWILCWHKSFSVSHGAFGFSNWEPVLIYGKTGRHERWSDYFHATFVKDVSTNGHPCPKPIGWATGLSSIVSFSGDTVLDPFMGSGTTGVACVKTGRKFIGIEIDPTYFDIACKRIEAATLQLRLPLEDA